MQVHELTSDLEKAALSNQEKLKVSVANICGQPYITPSQLQQANGKLTNDISALNMELESLKRKVEELKKDKDGLQTKLDQAFAENKKLFGMPCAGCRRATCLINHCQSN